MYPDTDTPRAVFGAEGAMNANPVTDRWIEDGSYLRLQNVEFGYRLPAGFSQRLGLAEGGLRLYVNLQNLYTFTGYSGWDPENIGTGVLGRGIDDAALQPRGVRCDGRLRGDAPDPGGRAGSARFRHGPCVRRR